MCDRDDCSFMLVDPVLRFFCPTAKTASTWSMLSTLFKQMPGTWVPPSGAFLTSSFLNSPCRTRVEALGDRRHGFLQLTVVHEIGILRMKVRVSVRVRVRSERESEG
jgi:hypothetical protein